MNSSGYISAHKEGSVTISVETADEGSYSFHVIVKNWQGLILPADLNSIEDEAFSGGIYEYIDLTAGSVGVVGDNAFSNNTQLKLVRANNQVRFGDNVFAGSTALIMACETEGTITDYAEKENIPFYVIGTEEIYQPVSDIALNENSTFIIVGSSYQLHCEILPINATNKSISWSSSNQNIAIVSDNGLVTTIKDGDVIISVSSRDNPTIKASCTITVLPVLVESITLNKTNINLNVGQNERIIADIEPATANNRTLVWTSSDGTIATVNENGVVNAIKAGTTTITASSSDGSGKSASCTVTVKATDVVDDSKFTTVYVDGITETNATIHTKVSLDHNPTFAGYFFGTNSNSLVLSATEDSSGMPLNNQIIWYNLNKWGKQLNPGTTYYYQFYIVYDGITYRTSVRSFTTAGTAGVVVDDSKFTTNYVDGITATNAVIHTKVSLPHNPSKAGYYFGTSANNLTHAAEEDASGMPLSNQIIWYDLNKWGNTLAPGTTYYYQFYIVYDNVTYKTSVRSFSTSGSITVNGEEGQITVYEGSSYKIPFTYTPVSATIQWSSSDTSIVTVDQQGNVYGVRGGTALVTAVVSADGQSRSQQFNIYVNPITYRIVIDANFQYKKEQILSATDLTVAEHQSYIIHHPILGFLRFSGDWAIDMKEWHPSAAKVHDGAALANLYKQFITSRGQSYSDVHFYSDISKSSLLANITSVFNAADENDVNFFFFGGHGNDSNQLFLPSGELIAPVELLSAFRGIKGNNVLLISSCFSGAVANTMNGYPYATGAVLAACEANHLSFSGVRDSVECSFDVYYFLQGLGFNEPNETHLSSMDADYNGDGSITIAEICHYMKGTVYQYGEGMFEQSFTYYYPNGNVVIYSR